MGEEVRQRNREAPGLSRGESSHYCCVCHEDLGPDNGDGICATCDVPSDTEIQMVTEVMVEIRGISEEYADGEISSTSDALELIDAVLLRIGTILDKVDNY